MDPVVADAEIARLEAQFQNADDHLKRVEPLLAQQFVTTDNVEKARTERASALAALNVARARKNVAVATLAATRAQHVATEAALRQARSQRASAEEPNSADDALVSGRLSLICCLRIAEISAARMSIRRPLSSHA
jgi:uncharacterized protein YqfA (UPF0365 family)